MGKIMYKGEEFQGKIERSEVEPIIEITYSDYGDLPQTEISNNCYYITDYYYDEPAISYYGVIFILEGGD